MEIASSSQQAMFEFKRLKHFPVSFLAVILGLMGFVLAFQKAEQLLSLPFQASPYLMYFTLVLAMLVLAVYTAKWIKHPDAVKKEFNHPIKLNFFPILAKLFLISSIIYLGSSMALSRYLWWTGVLLQSIFTIIILSRWIRHDKFEIHHVNPSWFIPVVGSIIIPIAGVQHFSPELSWFFFSIGFFWWIVLFAIVINRVIFHNPIPDKLIPTFFILFAPPVIGFISLTKLLDGITPVGNVLYYFGLSLFILVLFQIDMFSKIRFYLSWWAYSFPLDALAIGTLLMYHETGLPFFKYASWAIFILLNAVILSLLTITTIAISRRRICIEEED
jgi:tellurite resistance protein